MKELSIEEKAKAYDEAIKRAKAMIPVAANQEEIYNSVITIFPELKESEDERTRKSIIELLNEVHFTFKYYDINKMLAWLEKQGQVKEPTISQYEEDERIRETIIKILLCFDHYEGVTGKDMIAWVKNQGEQNPAEWSEKDEKMIDAIYSCVDSHYDGLAKDALLIWLKSLKDRYTWKPSDRQMNVLEYYMHTLACNEHKEILFGLYRDLKKLKG